MPDTRLPFFAWRVSNGWCKLYLDYVFLIGRCYALDQYKVFSFAHDKSKIEEHTDIANKVAEIVNRALKSGMIPPKYQTKSDIANIMNVALQGVNNTNDKEIYHIGMKIYNLYNPKPKTFVKPSGLDTQPSKTYVVPQKIPDDTNKNSNQ